MKTLFSFENKMILPTLSQGKKMNFCHFCHQHFCPQQPNFCLFFLSLFLSLFCHFLPRPVDTHHPNNNQQNLNHPNHFYTMARSKQIAGGPPGPRRVLRKRRRTARYGIYYGKHTDPNGDVYEGEWQRRQAPRPGQDVTFRTAASTRASGATASPTARAR